MRNVKKKKNNTEPSVFDEAAKKPPRRSGKKTSAFLRRSATEVMYFRIFRKIILIAVAIISSLLLVVYGFALVYDRTGSFTVNVKGQEIEYNISLCEDEDFITRSSMLSSEKIAKLTNICGNDLPANIDRINGDHSNERYLAYTFYCKNMCATECALNYELSFNNVTNGMDEAVRVRLYIDGEYTDYAKTRSDGGGKEEHLCDKTFANINVVCYGLVNNVLPDAIVRFTIVVWLEGDDHDCVDSVINGSIKFAMQISARDVVETQNG